MNKEEVSAANQPTPSNLISYDDDSDEDKKEDVQEYYNDLEELD